MLFQEPAQWPDPHIVQLGLRPGSLTKFCYRQLPAARVTVVELKPFVIEAAHTMFGLPPNDYRLHVLEQDAIDWVQATDHRSTVDVLQVDVYDGAHDCCPALQTPKFYRACRQVLREPGMMAINLYCARMTALRSTLSASVRPSIIVC